MSERDIQRVALFFLFTLLDEKLAFKAADKALNCIDKRVKSPTSLSTDAMMVAVTYKYWRKFSRKKNYGKNRIHSVVGWDMPNKVRLDNWVAYQKNSPQEELLAVTWSKILGFDDLDISYGLGITTGTVRYRVAQALKRLGCFQ